MCYIIIIISLISRHFISPPHNYNTMTNPFNRSISNSASLLDRVIKQNSNPVSLLANNKNQQNIPIQPHNSNKTDAEVIGSKINKTESIDIVEKQSHQVDAPMKNQKLNIQIADNNDKTRKEIQASPAKKGEGIFNPSFQKQLKKQDKIPRGRMITMKILNKQNNNIGQLKLDQNYIYAKAGGTLNANEASVQISKQFRKQCEQAWSKTNQYKNILNLALNATNLSILSNIAASPHQPMHENIIRRLREGFYFYEFNKDRDDAIRELLNQYTDMGINGGLCDQVKRITQKSSCKVDGAIAFYYCLNGGREDDCDKFLMEDRINLLRIYQQLMNQGRLSSRKLIKSADETTILQSLPKYYSKYMNSPLATELGREILALLNIVVIKRKQEVNQQELVQVFIPLIKQLQNILAQNTKLKSFMDIFMLELFMSWESELQGVQVGGAVEQFIAYYRRYQGSDINALKWLMVKLGQFGVYDNAMRAMIEAKCQQFIQRNSNCLGYSKQMLMHTAMESILLLKQCKKANIHNPKLLDILYQCCPLAIFSHLQSMNQHMEMILPLICKHYKKLSGSKSAQLTINQLNTQLPPTYALPTSQNYLIIKYLINLLTKYSRNQSVSSCYQKLDDIEETLLKFNASSIVRQTSDYVPLEIVKLICKYVVGFGSQDEDNSETGYEIVGLIFQAMQALVTYFENERKSGEGSFGGLICNVEMLGCVIMSSGILSSNRQKDSLQRRKRESENNSRIWTTYTKVTQLITKIWQQWDRSALNMGIVCRSCIRMYEEYWSRIKQTSRWVKYKVYLQSALTIMELVNQHKQGYDMMLVLDRKYKNYSIVHVLQEIVVKADGVEQADWQEIVRIALVLLSYLCAQHQVEVLAGLAQQVRLWVANISKIVMENAQQFLQLCVNRLWDDKSMPNPIQYCTIIYYILHQHHQQGLTTNRTHAVKISLLTLISKPIPTPFSKQPPPLPHFLSAIYLPAASPKLHTLFSLIAATFDGELLGAIVELGYLPAILNSTIILMDESITQSKKQQSWVITCLDLFSTLYFSRYVEVEASNGSIIAKALLHILTVPHISATPSQLLQYMKIILPLIANNTHNKSYLTLLRTFIPYIANSRIPHHLSYTSHKDNKEPIINYYISVIQVLMVYFSNDSITADIFGDIAQGEGEPALVGIAKLVCVMYDGLHEIGYVGENFQKWLRVLGVITLKISQYINILQTLSAKDLASTSKQLVTSIERSSKTVLSSVGSSLSVTLKQLLSSSVQLLETRSQTRSYNHYNEALVNLSMLTRASFTNYFVGVSRHIITSYQKQQRNNTSQGIENYRCCYLAYYFLQRVLQDQTGRYVNYLYQFDVQDYLSTEPKLQDTIKQTFTSLINQLTQCNNTLSIQVWHIVLIHSILKLQPRLIRTGTLLSKVTTFCCKLLQLLQNMSQQANYLEGWLCYSEVVSVMCFIYGTHSYFQDNVDEDMMNFLRKAIFQRVQLWIFKWDEVRVSEGQKFAHFPLWPMLNSTSRKEKAKKPIEILNNSSLQNYQLSKIENPPKDRSMNENRNERKQNKGNIWYYLKTIMTLHTLNKILALYHLDIEAQTAVSSEFKPKLIEFTQKMLSEYATYYDQYFGTTQPNTMNLQSLKKGILHYAKDPQITNNSRYLNKVLFSYTELTDRTSPIIKTSKNEAFSTSPGLSLPRELGATVLFNGIEEMLSWMGEKTSWKFMTAKSNGMLGSRRGSMSMRTSMSRRLV